MEAQRTRTFYDELPDYGRPRLQLPAERRERMRRRLAFLYGESQARQWLPELERILTVHAAHKPPEMLEKEQHYDPAERFHQGHEILITYGDMVKGEGETPLSVLHDFVRALYPESINTLHLLPFFPYSSDRGFAVVDFRRVDPKLGSWEDIRRKKARYDLMFDAVFNHCSSLSEMFLEYRNGHPAYRDFFIAFDSPDALTPEQRRKIFRPRTSDILTRFETIGGPRWVWTTFSPDQIDLNFRNPAVLMQVIDSILLYIRRGADLLRLDAVTYLWAEPGTESVHLPETHEIVKLLRDVVDAVALGVALVTETNVPHEDNVSYFGDGCDEAHMVYQFPLPPLVLHAFYRGDATLLSRWAAQVRPPSDRATFLNILDTHDGIGLVGAKGFLPPEEARFLVETARDRGAYVSYKSTGGGEEPYEINSTWWSALNPEDSAEPLERRVRRYLASRAIALVLPGVPGIYVHGALGTPNDHERVGRTGVGRDVNRGTIDGGEVLRELEDPASKLSLLHRWGGRMARLRAELRVFHPRGPQEVLPITPRVFAVRRSSPGEGAEHLIALINVTGERVEAQIPRGRLPDATGAWRDLLGDATWQATAQGLSMVLDPYAVAWLVPAP